jgi:hypothetical protein
MERVLDEILGVVPARRELPRDRERRPEVAADQSCEGLAVPPPRQNDQLGV